MIDTSSGGVRRTDRAGLVVGALLFVLAGVLWYEAYAMSGAVSYGVGPTAALKTVAIGLAGLAVATLVSALRGTGAVSPEPMATGPVLLVLAGCAFLILCIYLGGGFIIATAGLFAATATAFGRRKIVADLVIGLVLALVIYLMFSKLLTLTLPQGPLERLIG